MVEGAVIDLAEVWVEVIMVLGEVVPPEEEEELEGLFEFEFEDGDRMAEDLFEWLG
jgi:hypothetical protein